MHVEHPGSLPNAHSLHQAGPAHPKIYVHVKHPSHLPWAEYQPHERRQAVQFSTARIRRSSRPRGTFSLRPLHSNPTDRGKGGVKRSLLTEAQGIPVGLAVDGANRHDMKLVRATVDSLPVPRPAPSPDQPQGMCLDKGYDFDEVRRTLDEFGFTAHIRSRGEEAKAIKREAGFKARRWVVERSHSWLNRFRRILVRWDKSPDNYIAFLHFACALTDLRAAGLLG